MKRSYPFSKATGPNKRRYQKLNTMTDEEVKKGSFTCNELVGLISDGAPVMQVLRILKYHEHLINETNDIGVTLLMSALHAGDVNLVESLLQKNANPNQKSTTKFDIELTPAEFVQKILDEPSNKLKTKYVKVLAILNQYQEKLLDQMPPSFSLEASTTAGKSQSIRSASRVPTLAEKLSELSDKELADYIEAQKESYSKLKVMMNNLPVMEQNVTQKTSNQSKRNYQKLNDMTNEEIKNTSFTIKQLTMLIGEGASVIQVSRILTYQPDLINRIDPNGRTILMKALHRGNIKMVEMLLAKNANPHQKSATRFKIELTPTEFLQKMIDEPFSKSKKNYEKLLAILNKCQNKLCSSEVINLVDEEATSLTPTSLDLLPNQVLEEGHHVNASLELSPAITFLPEYEIQNQTLDQSNWNDLFADINNKPVVEQSVTDYLLYGLDELLANQSNQDYLMENFDDLRNYKP